MTVMLLCNILRHTELLPCLDADEMVRQDGNPLEGKAQLRGRSGTCLSASILQPMQ